MIIFIYVCSLYNIEHFSNHLHTYFGLESNSTKNGGISIHLAISRILHILLQPPKSLTPNKTNGPLNQQNSFVTEITQKPIICVNNPIQDVLNKLLVCKLGKYTYEEFLYISFTST